MSEDSKPGTLSLWKHALGTAGVMIAFSVIGTVILAYTHFNTKDPIAESERQAKLKLFEQVLPRNLHDNDLLKDAVEVPAGGALGNRDVTAIYRAKLGGNPSGMIVEATAPDGYSGDIRLLIGLNADGELVGVRVIAHKETPGLGDYIDVTRDPWIKKNFDGLSLAKRADDQWKVKKDGGQFDYMAGATITPRAVVKAVHKALRYITIHREELLAAPAMKGAT